MKRDHAIVFINLCVIAGLLAYLVSLVRHSPAEAEFIGRPDSSVLLLSAKRLGATSSDRGSVTTYSLALVDSPNELFRIEIDEPSPLREETSVSKMLAGVTFREGTLWPVDGAHGDEFLRQLAEIHGVTAPEPGKAVPPRPVHVAAIILGKHMAKQKGKHQFVASAFDPETTGPWTATKLQVGEEESEIYFHVDPEHGRAEFAVKDEDAGKDLVKEFAALFNRPGEGGKQASLVPGRAKAGPGPDERAQPVSGGRDAAPYC